MSRATRTLILRKPSVDASCGITLSSSKPSCVNFLKGHTSACGGKGHVYVSKISGLASAAGLQCGMTVRAINGTAVSGANEACALVKGAAHEVAFLVELRLPHEATLKCTILLYVVWSVIAANWTLLITACLGLGVGLTSWSAVVLGHSLLGVFSWSLVRTMRTHPGLVAVNWMADRAGGESSLESSSPPHFVCARSGRSLPPRACYIGLTGEAYLMLDHNCSWLRTPIGLRNRRHFLLLVGYAAVLSAFGALATGAVVCTTSLGGGTALRVVVVGGCRVLAVVDTLAAIVITSFAHLHWRLAARNRTSHNDGEAGSDAYDTPDALANLELVFGPRFSWAWVLPLRRGGPLIDGFTWPAVDRKAA